MQKRLFRSLVDRKIGGVCGGLGEYFNIDPVIVRALFAIAFFVYGTGLLAYIVLWIIVPSAFNQKRYAGNNDFSGSDSEHNSSVGADINMPPKSGNESTTCRSTKHNHFIGIALIVIGGIWVLNNILPSFDLDFVFPLMLLGFGILLLTRGVRGREHNQGEKL